MTDFFDIYNVEYKAIERMRTVLNWILPVSHERDQLLSLAMKAVFNTHPPSVKSKLIWDVSLPLSYIDKMSENRTLGFCLLSFKTVVLILLSTMCRKNVLTQLSPSHMMKFEDHFSFALCSPTKTFRASTANCPQLQQLIVHKFPSSKKLCPYLALEEYLEVSRPYRRHDKLFITLQPPFGPAAPATISRWVKTLLIWSGLKISSLVSQSTRKAMSSKAFDLGISVDRIVQQGGWTSQRTFFQYYNWPVRKVSITDYNHAYTKNFANLVGKSTLLGTQTSTSMFKGRKATILKRLQDHKAGLHVTNPSGHKKASYHRTLPLDSSHLIVQDADHTSTRGIPRQKSSSSPAPATLMDLPAVISDQVTPPIKIFGRQGRMWDEPEEFRRQGRRFLELSTQSKPDTQPTPTGPIFSMLTADAINAAMTPGSPCTTQSHPVEQSASSPAAADSTSSSMEYMLPQDNVPVSTEDLDHQSILSTTTTTTSNSADDSGGYYLVADPNDLIVQAALSANLILPASTVPQFSFDSCIFSTAGSTSCSVASSMSQPIVTAVAQSSTVQQVPVADTMSEVESAVANIPGTHDTKELHIELIVVSQDETVPSVSTNNVVQTVNSHVPSCSTNSIPVRNTNRPVRNARSNNPRTRHTNPNVATFQSLVRVLPRTTPQPHRTSSVEDFIKVVKVSKPSKK